MNTDVLEALCDFGSLTDGAEEEFDLTNESLDGTYCTDGGLIKVSVQKAGTKFDPKRFTFLANDGLITISGQNAFIEPFALSLLAMTDLDSDSDQFPIKISGSDFEVLEQAIAFSPRAGVDMSGSDGSLLCVHAVGQEIKIQGSNSSFGPSAPDCESLGINVEKVANPQSVSNAGQLVTYNYVVTNNGNVSLNNVTLLDDVQGPVDIGTGPITLQPGDFVNGTSIHPMTQAEIDNVTLTNVATAKGSSVSGQEVTDTDTQTVIAIEAPGIQVLKTPDIGGAGQPLPQAVGSTVVFNYAVSNNGNVSVADLVVSDNLEATVIFVGGDTDGDSELDLGETWSYTANHTVTQADLDAGVIGTATDGGPGTATASGAGPLSAVSDTDPGGVSLIQSPSISLVKTGTLDITGGADATAADPGDVISYDFTVTNTGNVTLTDVIVTDPLVTVIGLPIATLAVGASDSTTFSGSYSITQADIDAGARDNIALASGEAPGGNPADPTDDISDDGPSTVLVPQNPAIAILKTGSLEVGADNRATPGDVITYNFRVENTGNTTLTGVVLTDTGGVSIGALSDVAVDDLAGPPLNVVLAPGDVENASGTYAITQGDIDAGLKDNQADVEGTDPQGNPVTDFDTHSETVPQIDAIDIVKTGSLELGADLTATPGDVITYNFRVENTGNTTLTGVVLTDTGGVSIGALSDVAVDDLAGPLSVVLAPGAVENASGTYAITQADIDAGLKDNRADVDGTDPQGNPVTDFDTHSEPVPQIDAIDIVKTGTLNRGDDGIANPGDVITYNFRVENTGNTTLTDVTLTDTGGVSIGALSDVAVDDVAGPPLSVVLAPGAVENATGTYAITQADIDAGLKDNRADVDGTDPQGNPVTDFDTHSETVPQIDAIDIVKTGTLNRGDDGIANPGDVITYNFRVENTGNTTLTDVTLTDTGGVSIGALSDVAVDDVAGPPLSVVLAPGAVENATGTYAITQADIDAGLKDNRADVDGTDPQGNPVTDFDTHSEPVPQIDAIDIVKTRTLNRGDDGIANPGDVITYNFRVENTGNTTLTDVTLTDTGGVSIGAFSDVAVDDVAGPPLSVVLAPGAVENATGTYAITQADIDAGLKDNRADVDGTDPQGNPVTDFDTHSEPVPQIDAIDIVKTAQILTDTNTDGVVGGAGDVITYDYTATNTGNVTLTGVKVTDDNGTPANALDDIAVTNLSPTSLAPGAQATGTVTHTITSADIANGSFRNVALAEGTPPSGLPVTDTDPETVNFVNLSLAKTSVVSQVTATITNSATVTATNGSPDSAITNDGSVVIATNIAYTLTVTNSGDADAIGASLSDTLPAGTTVTSNPDGGTVVGNTITWNLGTIAARGSATLSVTVQPTNP